MDQLDSLRKRLQLCTTKAGTVFFSEQNLMGNFETRNSTNEEQVSSSRTPNAANTANSEQNSKYARTKYLDLLSDLSRYRKESWSGYNWDWTTNVFFITISSEYARWVGRNISHMR